jgi:oligogalacturonide lyase
MAKGERFPAEWHTFADLQTGVKVRQLTAHKGHSHHLYFTNPGWYGGGRKLLFGSDRGNRTNLFGIDLESGEITQLTDMDQPPPPAETSFLFASKNPRRDEVYFWQGRDLLALDLDALEERLLYRAPDGFMTNMTNVTADGRYVCTAFFEDLSGRFPVDLLHGYVGFSEYWEAMPLSRIVRIDTGRGGGETVFEERYWIGHVNTSPALPHILTFCHEGPWHRVDQRIWGLDMATGRAWKIRPAGPGEVVGHEYWFADGQRIGYHGRGPDGAAFYGCVRYDNTERLEAPFPAGSNHFHSNGLDLIVGDGSAQAPQLLLWRFRDGRFEGPRVVLTHRCSFHTQILHVHPRFSPDGRQILFVSDAGGYGNLHLIDTPDFDTLPPVAEAQG